MADQTAAVLSNMLDALDRTQWEPAERLAQRQFRQLGVLAGHCAAQSPHFARRLAAAGLTAESVANPEGFRRLPPLTRRALQADPDLFCRWAPPVNNPIAETRTSGSTGEPVVVQRTMLCQLLFLAMTMRDQIWRNTDYAAPFAAVRAAFDAVVRMDSWGSPVSLLHKTGPFLGVPITTDTPRLYDLLRDFRVVNLLIYPSTLSDLTRYCQDAALRLPELKWMRTIGETLSPELRERASAHFGAAISDTYSSQEIGVIALQCPVSGLYHTMDDAMMTEVLDEAGAPCAPGARGRVVVTDLHNFATPLIRYDIGDYAEVAEACPCGRGLGTLRRILGRERNLILMPDGGRHWPLVGFDRFRELAPVRQYQLIQHDRESIEVRLVTDRQPTNAEECALGAHIRASLGHDFRLTFTYFPDRLPLGASGKFEEFICRI